MSPYPVSDYTLTDCEYLCMQDFTLLQIHLQVFFCVSLCWLLEVRIFEMKNIPTPMISCMQNTLQPLNAKIQSIREKSKASGTVTTADKVLSRWPLKANSAVLEIQKLRLTKTQSTTHIKPGCDFFHYQNKWKETSVLAQQRWVRNHRRIRHRQLLKCLHTSSHWSNQVQFNTEKNKAAFVKATVKHFFFPHAKSAHNSKAHLMKSQPRQARERRNGAQQIKMKLKSCQKTNSTQKKKSTR